MHEKPPYRVPSMAEVTALPWNGFNVISTFAGCGGSSLGYRMAGFRVLWASEFVDAARESYVANARPGTVVDGRDIRKVDPLEVLATVGLKPGDLDVLDGSPPCASFSTAGKREKHWGEVKKYSDVEQRTDDLFFEYTRFVRAMQPKVFVAENVSGLVKGTAKGYFLKILAEMKSCGYRVQSRLLDAQWLGVPQARQRIIFVGVREDLGAQPAHPLPLPHRYSVRDALPWLSSVVHDTSGLFGAGEVIDRPSPAVTVGVHSVNSNHFKVTAENPLGIVSEVDQDGPAPTVRANPTGREQFKVEARGSRVMNDTGGLEQYCGGDVTDRPSPSVTTKAGTLYVEPECDISRYAIGAEYDKLNPGQQSDKYFNLVRSDQNKPAPTIMGASGHFPSGAAPMHPTEKRKFSIAELRRICAFPDDFALTGSYANQWERLGRAVPPLMMKAVAEVVRDSILKKL